MLAGNTVLFLLSPQGREALKDLHVENGHLEAFVLAQDEIGAWIVPEASDQVTLLKWDHFLTARFTFQLEETRARIGFR